MPGHHHRSGGLRQSNKKNKRSKASKRSLTRKAGGKVAGGKKGGVAGMVASSKADRRNHQQQKRNAKREEIMRKKRGLDGQSSAPPRVVGIIALGDRPKHVEDCLQKFITQGADIVARPHGGNQDGTVTCKFNVHKRDGNLTLLTCRSGFGHSGSAGDDEDGAVQAALDMARVCDLLLIVINGNEKPKMDDMEIRFGPGNDNRSTTVSIKSGASKGQSHWDHLISERGDSILEAIKAQGLPTALTVLAHTERDILDGGDDHMTMQSMKSLRRSSIKRHLDLKKYVNRFATTEFGNNNDKVIEVDLSSSSVFDNGDYMDEDKVENDDKKASNAAGFVRMLCCMSASPAKWVAQSPRSYLISDTHSYNRETKELQLSGYVRGLSPFDINSLVHVPNLGTFACKSLCKSIPPLSQQKRKGEILKMDNNEVIKSDVELRESLNRFATPDSLEGEQNLIGFDEDDEEDVNVSDTKEAGFARPAGWSDYQSAWLDAVDDGGLEDGDADHGELADALNKKSGDSASVVTDAMELEDTMVDPDELRSLIEQRQKDRSEHIEFPDEVQVDEDSKASDRFARYRSLKSFRKSNWDPKENLPETYSTIYHIARFRTTQRAVMNEMQEIVKEAKTTRGQFWGKTVKSGTADMSMDEESEEEDDILEGRIPSGSYITLTLQDIAEGSANILSRDSILTAVSLLPHENKVSVLHMGLSQSSGCDLGGKPVKSKDELIFRCGWRTWKARPVFSQNNLNSDKHKFERYMPENGAFFAASIFGPVSYTPCPVMVFRENRAHSMGIQKEKELIAVGSMIGADADRIVVKRIVLTGYPVRVHKRHATVKYMFYNPEDVKWFKPADLYTKHGLQGNIVQSVGEHGTMKCLFNGPIKQHDTVCLPLYKRIYPKFAGVENAAEDKTASSGRNNLVIM